MEDIVHVETITEAHQIFGLPKPKHPLVSVIYHKDIQLTQNVQNIPFTLGMFYIACKSDGGGSLKYGRSSYDFDEGSMLFVKPGQVIQNEGHEASGSDKGWTFLFHPDLIRRSELGNAINRYSFFSYDLTEALHLSEDEEQTLKDLLVKIESEYNQNIDRHTQKLIVSNIELFLDYCTRYYDRQFYTRTNLNLDILGKFETLLEEYYTRMEQINMGVPTVQYCGDKLNFSPKYLSDLLKKETGKSAKSHIDDFLIEKAKNRLLSSKDSVSEVAFHLGFEYSQHFSKMFKVKTGVSPSEYRILN